MGIVEFETAHGVIRVEADEDVIAELGQNALPPGVRAKAPALGKDEVIRAPQRFDEAMESLRVYAANIEDFVRSLDLTPSEVGVDVALKFGGRAGFIIASAEAESCMTVSLKWTPRCASTSE